MLTWLAIEWLGPLCAPVGSVLADICTVPVILWPIKRVLNCSVVRLFPWRDLAKVGGGEVASVSPSVALKWAGAAWYPVALLLVAGVVLVAVTASAFVALGLLDVWMMFHAIQGRLHM